jgi:hypothetical protein
MHLQNLDESSKLQGILLGMDQLLLPEEERWDSNNPLGRLQNETAHLVGYQVWMDGPSDHKEPQHAFPGHRCLAELEAEAG